MRLFSTGWLPWAFFSIALFGQNAPSEEQPIQISVSYLNLPGFKGLAVGPKTMQGVAVEGRFSLTPRWSLWGQAGYWGETFEDPVKLDWSSYLAGVDWRWFRRNRLSWHLRAGAGVGVFTIGLFDHADRLVRPSALAGLRAQWELHPHWNVLLDASSLAFLLPGGELRLRPLLSAGVGVKF